MIYTLIYFHLVKGSLVSRHKPGLGFGNPLVGAGQEPAEE